MLPTGRNLHGFDPFRIPSAFAVADGARQAERLLARICRMAMRCPKPLPSCFGEPTISNREGGPMAQALALMGATPRFDGYGRLAGATLIPLVELAGRASTSIITLSGIFRDLLPLQTK